MTDPMDQIDTPALCLDLDIAERNIRRYQAYCDKHGLSLRPHIKTHKMPFLADAQLAQGACGITCQKISEAEAMLDGMATRDVDILITYNILGATKLERLRALATRCKLSVVADNASVVEGLSGAFADAETPLGVLVECNTGADRCGVSTPLEALHLAQRIDAAPGLCFGGLMTYPPVGQADLVSDWLTQARDLITQAGLSVPVISSGGSPNMWQAHQRGQASEYRIGTYVFNDRSLVHRGVCSWQDCALTVWARVVSVPAPNRAIIDAGSKVLTSDLLGMTGHGHVLFRPDLSITTLSEEHGTVVSSGQLDLAVGDVLRIVPNHVCVTVNTQDSVTLLRNGKPIGPAKVSARGRVV